MITIKPSPTADTRTCDVTQVPKSQLLASSLGHISDVAQGLAFWSGMLTKAAGCHDYDKLTAIDAFYADFQTKFEQTSWWDNHRKIHRHHLEQADGVPEDVNLIDVLEYITDCVMAGMARSGEVRPLVAREGLLEKAFVNTVELLKAHVQVDKPQTFQDRLIIEHRELVERYTKLEAFLAKPAEETKVGGDDRALLVHQAVAMAEYKEVLEMRMERLGILPPVPTPVRGITLRSSTDIGRRALELLPPDKRAELEAHILARGKEVVFIIGSEHPLFNEALQSGGK